MIRQFYGRETGYGRKPRASGDDPHEFVNQSPWVA